MIFFWIIFQVWKYLFKIDITWTFVGLSFGANTGSSLFGATTTTQSAGFGGFGSSTGSSGLFGAATGGAGLFGGSSASGIGIGTGVGFGAFKPATGLQGAQANTSSNAQGFNIFFD